MNIIRMVVIFFYNMVVNFIFNLKKLINKLIKCFNKFCSVTTIQVKIILIIVVFVHFKLLEFLGTEKIYTF